MTIIPREILETILDDANGQTLLTLRLTCRRFYQMTLSIRFKRRILLYKFVKRSKFKWEFPIGVPLLGYTTNGPLPLAREMRRAFLLAMTLHPCETRTGYLRIYVENVCVYQRAISLTQGQEVTVRLPVPLPMHALAYGREVEFTWSDSLSTDMVLSTITGHMIRVPSLCFSALCNIPKMLDVYQQPIYTTSDPIRARLNWTSTVKTPESVESNRLRRSARRTHTWYTAQSSLMIHLWVAEWQVGISPCRRLHPRPYWINIHQDDCRCTLR